VGHSSAHMSTDFSPLMTIRRRKLNFSPRKFSFRAAYRSAIVFHAWHMTVLMFSVFCVMKTSPKVSESLDSVSAVVQIKNYDGTRVELKRVCVYNVNGKVR
jgi:hypothetical protein